MGILEYCEVAANIWEPGLGPAHCLEAALGEHVPVLAALCFSTFSAAGATNGGNCYCMKVFDRLPALLTPASAVKASSLAALLPSQPTPSTSNIFGVRVFVQMFGEKAVLLLCQVLGIPATDSACERLAVKWLRIQLVDQLDA